MGIGGVRMEVGESVREVRVEMGLVEMKVGWRWGGMG